ncbi:MAG: outer membrane lipoprotein carrier protein LolA [Alphaproteobacteria bacterium]|nr:outer membrane lipoprotein carrier protein LolA [Alphaproteobacteria bacterium]MBU0805264.1 outer membrane lipoprotein carrier protein LolA [Alphaproteobacteria bacterium]MBU0870763.1 outer membrane lipoprotein carrier protein LolA [Alphaproteobacteria bacterium]MBU1401562.1 outer membrane lipoprotein carrier protein LolA [Alphaproteobacteria bacterium]MBU1592021.1 outer membrane lipoprotein carrier protein LolA [Alphaproteobacteria bacterium]
MPAPAIDTRFSRRGLLGLASGGLAVATLALAGMSPAQAASDTAQKIADHFSSVKSMTGEFVQFGPRGEQTGGKFFLQRPGKVRFNYEAPSAYEVISDGKSVAIDNSKLNTMDLYPLSKTPLKLLLDTRIDLSGSKVKSVKEDEDLTTIQLSDRSVFGNSTITMMFDPKSYELRQWTITDNQGKDTTIMIFNVKQGVSIDPKTFKVDYERNLELNSPSRRQRGG